MANSIEETISGLSEIILNARTFPLGQDKCIVARDKVLDMLDAISDQLPGAMKQAQTIVQSRDEVINNAKRQAESILKEAEEKAKLLVSENEIYKRAQDEANAMIDNANAKIADLRRATTEYIDSALEMTEQSIQNSLAQVRDAHAKFDAKTGAPKSAPVPNVD